MELWVWQSVAVLGVLTGVLSVIVMGITIFADRVTRRRLS